MNSTKDVRVGVIGLGVGEQHLIGYKKLNNVLVTAVSDLNTQHALNVVKKHKLKGVKIDPNPDNIINNNIVDAISICSYDNFHASQAIRAFENGIHVMVEKPAVLKRTELPQLVRAWQDSKKILTSNLILRESPRFKALKKLIDSQKLGEIFYIEGDYIHNILWKLKQGWRGLMSEYSVIYGGGVHLIDLMRFLIQKEIIEVFSMGTNIRSRNSQYKFDDTIVSLMKFDNDILCKCTSSFSSYRPQLHGLSVYGSKGTWINDTPDGRVFFNDDINTPAQKIDDPYPQVAKNALLGSFIASIQGGDSPTVTGEDVIRVMDICLTANESLYEKKALSVVYSI